MDWRNYLSVMTPAASAGNIVYNITTYDAETNISLNVTVSATTGESEIALARRINEQVTVQLVQASAQYSGLPAFSSQVPQATFYLGQTDHIVSVWSQATFLITEVSNATGAAIQISSSPTFVTLAQGQDLGPLLGLDYTDANEVALTDAQIMTVLQLASDQIVRLTNNDLVIACYLHEYIGSMQGTILLRQSPIVNYDRPAVLPPILVSTGLYYVYNYYSSFQVDRKLRLLNYRFGSNLMNAGDPFDTNNEVKVTYRAGYMNIPRIVQEKTLLIVALMLNDPNVSELRGGSFQVKFRLPIETLKAVSAELSAYKIS